MALNPTLREEERARIARHVLDLVKQRGSEIRWRRRGSPRTWR
jgi:TetR/AcrR family transcriptional regulator, repressor of the ameABC operon